MSTTKAAPRHTSGPWRADGDPEKPHAGRTYVEGQLGWDINPICNCDTTYDVEENEANARLIAAAPDLLDALRFALPYLEQRAPTAWHRARYAIAKAVGEG